MTHAPAADAAASAPPPADPLPYSHHDHTAPHHDPGQDPGHQHHHHHHHDGDPPQPVEPYPGGLPFYTDDPSGRREAPRNHERNQETQDSAGDSIAKSCFAILFAAFFIFTGFNILRSTQTSPYPHPYPSTPSPLDPIPGDIGCSPKHHSRSYTQHEVWKPITGEFPLDDLLDLSTVSGAIDITVTPRPGCHPAVLRVHSTAGSITVRLSDSFLRNVTVHGDAADGGAGGINTDPLTRQFDTHIDSQAGSVTAALLIGNGGATEVVSQAASLNLTFFAVGVGPDSNHGVTLLTTSTQLSAQTVRVLPLQSVGGGPVTRIRAEHVSQGVGALDIVYPPSWEGRVEATVQGSGRVDLAGERLVVDHAEQDVIKAHRGKDGKDGDLVHIATQGQGSVKFRC